MVGLLNELLGLLGSDAFLACHACYAVLEVGCEEEVDAAWMVAQDVVGTASDEDARLLFCKLTYDIALHLEQGVVAQV